MRLPRLKRWLFRAAAVILSLLPLLLMELICVAAGWGNPSDEIDPFVGFSSIQPLFVADETGDKYIIAPNRRRFFAHDEFSVGKGRKTFRAFCLGGSTVQGNPYSIETAFPRWMQIALNEADPRRDWEFINCGGVSYASYRLVPILQEVLRYRPDLIIVCTGHNEFLEDRSYSAAKNIPQWAQTPISWLARRRTAVLVSRLLNGNETAGRTLMRPELGPETEPMLDFNNGIAAYHWDPEWHDGIVRHYRYNVRRMIHLCRQAGVPIIIVKPCSNLADTPPFKSEHKSGLTSAELEQWRSKIEQAHQHYASNLPEAIFHLKQAVEIDPQYALSWYELGQAYEASRDFAAARQAFITARDCDVCPLRMTSALECALEEIVRSESVPYLDAHELLEGQVPSGILGDYWLVDHVHPSFEGNQLIAVGLVELMAKSGLADPLERWQELARAAFKKHFESLDATYFHSGRRHLEGLRNWAKGRADGPPAESRFPHRIRKDD